MHTFLVVVTNQKLKETFWGGCPGLCRSLKPRSSCFSSRLRKCLIASSMSSLSGLASMYSSSCGSCPEPGSNGGAGMGRRALRKPVHTRYHGLSQLRNVQLWVIPLQFVILLGYPVFYNHVLGYPFLWVYFQGYPKRKKDILMVLFKKRGYPFFQVFFGITWDILFFSSFCGDKLGYP